MQKFSLDGILASILVCLFSSSHTASTDFPSSCFMASSILFTDLPFYFSLCSLPSILHLRILALLNTYPSSVCLEHLNTHQLTYQRDFKQVYGDRHQSLYENFTDENLCFIHTHAFTCARPNISIGSTLYCLKITPFLCFQISPMISNHIPFQTRFCCLLRLTMLKC